MTLSELSKLLGLKTVCLEHDCEFNGVYAGDFLSRAMSHVKSGNLWLTIMSNANVIAVRRRRCYSRRGCTAAARCS